MPRIDELRDEPLVAHRLTIAGLPLRFTSLPRGVTLPPAAVPGTDLFYQDINVLLPLRREWVELDPVGDIAEASGLQLELVVDDDAADHFDLDAIDDALERVGERLTLLSPGARWSARVIADIAPTDTTLYIDADLSAHSYPRLMWIAHEAVWVTAAAGSVPDPNDADPYRLTVVRGVAATRARRYDVTPELLDYHTIYSDMVSWRRRRAVLEVAPVWGMPGEACKVPDDGWMELPNGRGFIEAAPEPPGPHDISIKMRLHPLASIIDTEVELPASVAGLVQGVHHFEGELGRVFEWAVYTPRVDLDPAEFGSAADSGVIASKVELHRAAFDLGLPTARLNGRRRPHPRRGRLLVANHGGAGYQPTGYVNADLDPVNGEAIEVDPGPRLDIDAGAEVFAAPCTEMKRVVMPAGVQDFPGTFIDLVNGEVTESTQGLDGAHARLTIVPGDEGWSAIVTSNLDNRRDQDRAPQVLLWDPWETNNPRQAINGRGRLRWGFYGDDPLVVWRSDGSATGRATEVQQLFSYPLRYRMGNANRPDSSGVESTPHGLAWLALSSFFRQPYTRVFEFATAWYQTGERGVLVDTEVAPPAEGEVLYLVVEWSEPWMTERRMQTIGVTAVEEIALPDGGTAWYLVLKDPHLVPSFGDWGLEPATLKLSPVSRSGGVMLERLFRDYLDLDDDDIDVPSFRHVPDPPGMVFTVPRTGRDPVALRDVTHGPLVATSTALVMRTDELGRSRLTRVPVGIQTVHESVLHITDALCVEPPTYSAERDTVSRVIISSAYDDNGEPARVQRFHHRGIGGENGGDGETLELELRSVIDVTEREMLAVAQRIFVLRGRSRRLWHLAIPLGWAYTVYPGAVVQVSSDYLRGYGKVGVEGLFGRVRRVEYDHEANIARLVVVHHDKNGSGWNTSLKIESIISPTRLQVSAGPWSPANHPVTGRPFDVWTLWATGYGARIVPYGDHDSGPLVGIDEIDTATDQIEFDAPHGLVSIEGLPLGEVEPPPYHLAAPVQQQLMWLTDAAGRLGVDGPLGFVAV